MVYGFECLRCECPYAEYQAYCTRLVADHRCGGTVSAVYESQQSRADRRAALRFDREHRDHGERGAQGFQPIAFFEDERGHISVPGANDARPRRHQVKKEARTIREIEALEKRLNRQELDVAERVHHQDEVRRAMSRSNRRSQLRQDMNHMSPAGREFARKAMERNDARSYPLRDPGVHFDILHMDASNRDPYCDKRTGWRDRKV